jgi:hypothetical protein
MRKLTLFVLFVLLALMAFVGPVQAHGGIRVLTTSMLGREEVPGPGDPDGFGVAVLVIDVERSRLCFGLRVRGIAPATAAHIHIGAKGVAGSVVVTLTPPTSGLSQGCVTVDQGLLAQIVENPDQHYVNVHNADFPAGALRGQLGD